MGGRHGAEPGAEPATGCAGSEQFYRARHGCGRAGHPGGWTNAAAGWLADLAEVAASDGGGDGGGGGGALFGVSDPGGGASEIGRECGGGFEGPAQPGDPGRL